MIEVDDNPQWWVDRSCDVYPDMKSHMGVIVCMASSKQKFNTTTEAKLVAIDDAMGHILLTRHFISAKGVQTTIYHDNKSKILLSEIRRLSSSKISSILVPHRIVNCPPLGFSRAI